MSAAGPPPGEHRAPNGIFYRIAGAEAATDREPLLLLHGLMVSGAMFDPLVALLAPDFRLIVPDLRGHGASGDLAGPYDVAQLAADLDAVLADAAVPRCAVLGYSHGGAVAQQLAHTRPAAVARLLLVATYACNVATPRERIEAAVLAALLGVFTPGGLARLIVQSSRPRPDGEIGADADQVRWLRALMAANRAAPMRAAARGLATFDARPWLADLAAPPSSSPAPTTPASRCTNTTRWSPAFLERGGVWSSGPDTCWPGRTRRRWRRSCGGSGRYLSQRRR